MMNTEEDKDNFELSNYQSAYYHIIESLIISISNYQIIKLSHCR